MAMILMGLATYVQLYIQNKLSHIITKKKEDTNSGVQNSYDVYMHP